MEEEEEELREIGHLASWSVTSAKAGNGVELLRDGDATTFWQSDGVQPHLITIQFERRVELLELHLLLDFKLDESYTPSRVAVRAGSGPHDLRDVALLDLKEPSGWVKAELWHAACSSSGGGGAAGGGGAGGGGAAAAAVVVEPLRAFCLQVAVLANHQNGRDTHVRGVRVLAPRPHPLAGQGLPLSLLARDEAAPYAVVR